MDRKKDEVSERRSNLSFAKRALLEKRLRGEVNSDSRLKVISRRSSTEKAPLSFAQQRLWFLHLFDSASAAYNELASVQLLGSLNVAALESSINEVVRRHEALRTTFTMVDGQGVQVIAPTVTVKLSVVNLRELPQVERKAQVQRWATQEVQRPFSLDKGPLLRGTLLQLDEQEHLLLFVMHHIICDGWSMRVMIREVAALYEAFNTGKPSGLPELPIQYADFAVWQRQWSAPHLQTHLCYWKQQLAGSPPMLELPTDKPRPSVQRFQGATTTFKLSPRLTGMLKSLSQRQGCTLFMTLLTAFGTLLYRYTGQEDISVGSPIANRNRIETQGLIGVFVNTLVMRTNFSLNPSFQELLLQVREVALDAYAHEDLPFEQLVEELQPERNLSHHPLFQVMFALQDDPMEDLALPDLRLSRVNIDVGTAKFDLTLYMVDSEPALTGWLEYNTDLFDAVTIDRMIGHFTTLLEGIVINPEQRLSDLPLLTEREQHQLLLEWNNTTTDYPKDACIHQLFEAQVERSPDAVAMVFEDEQLTYQQLNRRANQLAHHLRSLGVGPNVKVGICIERSLLMVVGLLGILKAGGAYVPLDSTYPPERLLFMLEDAHVQILLTQERLIAALLEHKAKVVSLDRDWADIACLSEDNLLNELKPDNLAYVIYTSGSTGQPKGVQITHRSAVNFLTAMRLTLGLTEADIFLSVTIITFDIAANELYLPLIVGARLVVVSREVAADGTQLSQRLAQSGATVMQATPATWQLLVEAGWLGSNQLKILCGGEAISRNLANQLLEKKAVLWNLYGPTESTIWSTVYQVKADEGIVFIGNPIANTQLYVLDRHLQPVPIGVPGELHIGGAGLAWGYQNRPDLTALKFIPNQCSNFPGARLYKTGDRVRYRADGNIEFLGRLDYQVKVRGFRIELGEIEAVLSQHPQVKKAVVLAWEDEPENKRLVAYVVPHPKSTPTITELRSFLKETLPNYMLPSAFVMLEELPLLPNGKINRRALPAPGTKRPDLEIVYMAPRNSVEEVLAEIWSGVLGVEQVGIHDNFFEVGGDSILSIQAIARAKQAGVQLTPKQMFEHQTIAELAAVADTTPTVQAEQGPVAGLLPLIPIQQWFFEQNQPDLHHWNLAILQEVLLAIDSVILQQALQQLMTHHDALRLRFVRSESGWQQINTSPDDEVVSLTRCDLSALSKQEQESAIEAAIEELQRSLNLSEGPLVRFALFNLGLQQSNRLLIVVHHLAFDGTSWRILLEDLQTAYQQLSLSQVIHLPLKTTSFKQWSYCVREYAQSAVLQQELAYWLAESRKQVSRLPVDYPGGDNTVASAQTVSVALSVEESQALLQSVPQVYHLQMSDVLVAVVVQAVAQWTKQRTVLVDLEANGREKAFDGMDLSLTVGWFTTIFPVLIDLGEATNPGDVLKAVKEQLRRIPDQGFGYGVLRYLSENREITEQLQNLSQAELVFNYWGQVDRFIPEKSMFGKTHWILLEQNRSPRGIRSHLVEVYGFVTGGQLWLHWTYSKNIHQRATVESLATGCVEALRSLIAHCQSPEAGGYTPSDFPDVELSQQKLDKALAEIDFS